MRVLARSQHPHSALHCKSSDFIDSFPHTANMVGTQKEIYRPYIGLALQTQLKQNDDRYFGGYLLFHSRIYLQR